MTRRSLGAGVALLGALTFGAATAHATVFGGTASFTDNGPPGNGVTFSASFPGAGGAFATNDLTAGGSQTFDPFATINGFMTSPATDNVSLNLSFTQPDNTGSVSQGGQATGAALFIIVGFLTGGSLTWNAPQFTDAGGTYSRDLVTFADGASADVDIYNVTLAGGFDNPFLSGDLKVRITDVSDPTPQTPVPEPASMALLGSGLLGLGLVRRRRRS